MDTAPEIRTLPIPIENHLAGLPTAARVECLLH